MYRECIAVVDASRARLMTLERTLEPSGLDEQLVEQRDFINPSRRLTPSQQLSDSPSSGRMRDAHFGIDDHRDARTENIDADFARSINREIAALLGTLPAKRLVLCASPRMLGHLRESRDELPRDLSIVELPRDLTKLTLAELRDRLAAHGLIPVRSMQPRTA